MNNLVIYTSNSLTVSKSKEATPTEIPHAHNVGGPKGSTAAFDGGDFSEIMNCTANMQDNYEVITDDSSTEVGNINGARVKLIRLIFGKFGSYVYVYLRSLGHMSTYHV